MARRCRGADGSSLPLLLLLHLEKNGIPVRHPWVRASLEEGVNPERVAILCLFHDVQETRTGDLNGMNQRYANAKEGEHKALLEQAAHLPQDIAQKVLAVAEEYTSRSTPESRLVKEADTLECLLQCREYHMQGYAKAQSLAQMCYDGLRSEIARSLARACLSTDPGQWFETVQENPYIQKATDV